MHVFDTAGKFVGQKTVAVDSEYVTCGLSADYKLSLAGVGGADNAFWSVKGD